MTEHRFYGSLAPFWPLLSPVSDYEEEAAYFTALLVAEGVEGKDVLELGSGGGHNAFHMRAHFSMTLTDLSEEMLTVSRALNPACAHVQGDMRTLRLGRTFDAVFIHDAIDYMASEAELRAALVTARAHLEREGVCVIVPDAVRETFEAGTEHGGTDADDGRGIRYLEWSWDPDPSDDWTQTEYSLLAREADGTVHAVHESHRVGLFSLDRWLALLDEAGFRARVVAETTDEDRTGRRILVARAR